MGKSSWRMRMEDIETFSPSFTKTGREAGRMPEGAHETPRTGAKNLAAATLSRDGTIV